MSAPLACIPPGHPNVKFTLYIGVSLIYLYAMERKVIHLNIADFSVAVERLLDNSLKHKPLIIAPSCPRAMVHDMSEEAYQDGVRKGMRLSRAKKLCRPALIIPPRPDQYQRALVYCARHALLFTPLVERSCGHGHLYLDVTGTHRLFGPPPDIGWRLRKILLRELGLNPIWSVGPNKLVSKVASRLVKPTGEYIVASGEEQNFLAPLPLGLLPGLTPLDFSRLQQVNIQRVHQAAALSVMDLSVICNDRARYIYQAVRGIDPTPVQPKQNSRNTLRYHHTFAPDTNQEPVIRAALSTLAAQAGYALRQQHLGCRRVAVELTYTDSVQVTRQALAKTVVANDQALDQLAATALYRGWYRRVRLQTITLSCSRLSRPARQLSLFKCDDVHDQKNNKISTALDLIHKRYGAAKIHRGIEQPRSCTFHPTAT